MAAVSTKRAKVTEVTLTLNRDEALALWHLCRRVRQSPNVGHYNPIKTVKHHTDEIKAALANAFVDEISGIDLESIDVFGGNIAARTRSLEFLDPSKS